ncbi:MAG: DUF58 domain-containing protein [Gammaproteobacteria bacterium]|nr:DUF58 domain-containing protein [Gammaproteobacteria bacterium]
MFRRLLYKNLKFLFRVSQWNKHRLTPLGLLIMGGMISSAIFGVDVRQSLAFYIFSICISLLLVASLSLISFQGRFGVKRLLPQYGVANQTFRYRLEISNRTNNNQQDLLIADELQTRLPEYSEFTSSRDPQDKNRNRFDRVIGYPRLLSLIRNKSGGVVETIMLEKLLAKETMQTVMEMTASRRGYVNFSAVKICRADPFGLVRAIRKLGHQSKLLILPKTYEVPVVELKGFRKYQKGGMSQASLVGDSQEFMSLRDYRPGDPIRAIHWRSYAKMGTPVVKEFHDEFFVRQGLILDTFQEETSSLVFEEAVSVAASFCITLPGQDAILDLMFIADKAYRHSSGRGQGRTESLLETLACVEAAPAHSFSKLQTIVHEHSEETSGIICVLLSWDSKRQALIESIIRLGLLVIVFLISDNPKLFTPEPGPLSDQAQRLVVLRSGFIQADLNKLNLSALLEG